MSAFCPIDSFSEGINKKSIALVQLGVIMSLVVPVALSCGKTVHHGCHSLHDLTWVPLFLYLPQTITLKPF